MAKPLEHLRAHDLRKRGKSIADIATTLGVSKSTVSYWCRDIPLSKKAIETLAQKSKNAGTKGLLVASENKRRDRGIRTALAYTAGKSDIAQLSDRDILCVGLGLYWGEGYKKGNDEFGFTNSDPLIILFFIQWVHKIYRVDTSDLILRVSINMQHAYRVSTVEKYWSLLTGIPLKQFTKTSLIKTTSKKIYKNSNDHYGTLRIKVRRGANLRRRILGSIQALQSLP